jgi:hypothetical protein
MRDLGFYLSFQHNFSNVLNSHFVYFLSSHKNFTIDSVFKQNISISHSPFTFIVKFLLVTYQDVGVVLLSGGKNTE